MKEKIYTTYDVARIFKVSPATVRWWIRKGYLQGFRIGGPRSYLRFKESDIARMIKNGSPKSAGSK